MQLCVTEIKKKFFVSPVFSGNLVILWDAECLKEELKDKVSHQGRCRAVCKLGRRQNYFDINTEKTRVGRGRVWAFFFNLNLVKSDKVSNTQQVVITN